jgi:hypothetical protein
VIDDELKGGFRCQVSEELFDYRMAVSRIDIRDVDNPFTRSRNLDHLLPLPEECLLVAPTRDGDLAGSNPALHEKAGDVRDQTPGHGRTNDCDQQVLVVRLENPPRDSPICSHQIDDVERLGREIVGAGMVVQYDL